MIEIEGVFKRTLRIVLLPVSLQGKVLPKTRYLGRQDGKIVFVSVNGSELTFSLKEKIEEKYGKGWSDPEKFWSDSS